MAPYRDTHAAVFAEGYEGDAASDLLSSYEEDEGLATAAVTQAQGERDVLSLQLTDLTASSESEINRLKAVNYDLLTQIGSAPEEGSDSDESDIGIETVDDLFDTLKE